MSEPVKPLLPLPDARHIRAHAAEWILRQRIAEDWSGEDQSRLDAWLAQSPAHLIAYWRLDETWERTNRLAALKRPLSGTAEAPQRARRLPFVLKIAATFAIMAALGTSAAYVALNPGAKTYATPVGGHEIVKFADGTRIELNTDTVIHTRMTTESRIVWLDKGEAYFQVKHDAVHPFTVMIGGRRVTDLGTKFAVRRQSEKLQVTVVQGRVRFDAPNVFATKQTAMLTPGDVAIATQKSLSVVRESNAAIGQELGWRKGVLVFHQATLAAAAAEFNRYNAKKIVIADPVAARFTIGATFPVNGVEAFTRLAKEVFALHVEDKGNVFEIAR
jgi:transmembrane sensor